MKNKMNSVLIGMANNVKNADKTGRVFSYLRWSTDSQTWGDSERRQNMAAEQWLRPARFSSVRL